MRRIILQSYLFWEESAVDPINEQRRLWKLICFQFLIGNTEQVELQETEKSAW